MTPFEAQLGKFLSTVRQDLPQGVLVEIDHFKPDGWSSAVRGGVCYVEGPASPEWGQAVRRLVAVLAYAEGSLLRRTAADRWELYTWQNDVGDGFKVVFSANATRPNTTMNA